MSRTFIMDTSEQIKNHIAKGEPDKAIKLLLEFTKEERPDAHDEALLLSGQYRQWKREITLGVQHSNNELRRIEVGIIDVLNDEETYEGNSSRTNRLAATPNANPAIPQAQKSNLTSILLGIFGTISVAFILMLMIPAEEGTTAENKNTMPAPVEETKEENPKKTVFGGGLTEDQFDKSLSNYTASTGTSDAARFDISTVIQVRYTTGEKTGFFESVANTNEWIERGADLGEIKARYKEVDRKNRTITLRDTERERTRFIAIDEDKIYEQVETYPKFHVFNITGVY